MSTKKLIAFDIDGTLFTSQHTVLPSTLQAIHYLKENGHFVTLATGRSIPLASSIIQTYQFDHYILMNGALGFFNHQTIIEEPLDKSLVSHLLDVSTTYGSPLAYQTKHKLYRSTPDIPDTMQHAMDYFGARAPIYQPETFVKEKIYQCIGYYNESPEQEEFEAQFPEFNFVRWHPFGLDVIKKGNSKAKALKKMAHYLQLDEKDIVCFGDGLNDREMLSQSGIGIAMGNASDQVKETSDFVTDTNDNDGISKALKHFGFI